MREQKKKVISKKLKRIVIMVAIVLAVAVFFALGFQVSRLTESKTTKLGFEDIGELATQSAYCTEVNVTDNSRELFNIKIPFTQSKYVYSYDIVIKAGYDFGEIEWSEKDNKEIEVKLPEAKILSSDLDTESFKVYHEAESIYTQIGLEDNNEALKGMKKNAEKDAISNGLLENARSNAETVLRGFIGNVYDLNEYTITFVDK
ncbi:flagellar basal body-associated protein FliL [Lachnospiraceae bacterium PF1-22]|uniref:DUF4230 domain-containing protein n=1 Tax=Ohessyouella blattaphilus TaxID=2949333 RepID=UPI003E268C0F